MTCPVCETCRCPGGRPAADATFADVVWNPPPELPELGDCELYVVEFLEKKAWRRIRGSSTKEDAVECARVYSVYGQTRVRVYGPKDDAAQPLL